MSADAYERLRAALQQRGSKVENAGADRFMAQCPAHEDGRPSLSVRRGDRCALVYCFAGCDTAAIMEALGLTKRDLFDADKITYTYGDGLREFKVTRTTSTKGFRQSGATQGWDAGKPLYRLASLAAAVDVGAPVWFTEGEKDADLITAAGGFATTNAGGADNAHTADFSPLAGAHVRVLSDLDTAGDKHRESVVKLALAAGAATVSVWKVKAGKDYGDHHAAGYGLDDLEHVAEVQTDQDHNSWQRQAVDAILDGTYVPEVADLLPRDDGIGLFYRGRTHSIHAESESGKSLLVQYEAARLLNAGEAVAYIDFESDLESVVRRLLNLGADPEAVRARFDYRRPEVAPAVGSDEGSEWAGLLRTEYALVIIDGVTEAMDILAPKSPGGDLNERIASFLRRYPTLIADRTGAAVVLIDHVVKNTENRGRHAYGGQHKMNGLTGAAYTVEVKTQPRRGHLGELHLFVAKDRPAGIRPHCGPVRPDRTQLAAVVTIGSKETGEQLAVTVAAPSPDTADTGPGTFRPTFLMERVSRWLQAHPGAHSRTQIVEDVTGKKSALKTALDVLADEGYITTEEHTRGSITQRNHTFARLFTEADDTPESADDPKPVPPVPNGSQTGPGTHTQQTGPTGPTPLHRGPVDGTGIDPAPQQQQSIQTGPTCSGCGGVTDSAGVCWGACAS